MKMFFCLSLLVTFGFIPTAKAADPTVAREKVKSNLLMPECSWSKMPKAEYDQCQKKRQTMKVMTPEERAKYLKETDPGSVNVGDPGGLIRNRALNGNGPRGG